jgi:transposase
VPPDAFHPTAQELAALRAAARSRGPFARRRGRALLALARGLSMREAAREAGCTYQAVCKYLAAFRAEGVACLTPKRRGPSGDAAWPPGRDADLAGLLRQDPREYGRARDWWTLRALAEVAVGLGWCRRVFSRRTIRAALARQGVRWPQARWWSAEPHRAARAARLGEAEAALKKLREAPGDKGALARLGRALRRMREAVEAAAPPAEP